MWEKGVEQEKCQWILTKLELQTHLNHYRSFFLYDSLNLRRLLAKNRLFFPKISQIISKKRREVTGNCRRHLTSSNFTDIDYTVQLYALRDHHFLSIAITYTLVLSEQHAPVPIFRFSGVAIEKKKMSWLGSPYKQTHLIRPGKHPENPQTTNTLGRDPTDLNTAI